MVIKAICLQECLFCNDRDFGDTKAETTIVSALLFVVVSMSKRIIFGKFGARMERMLEIVHFFCPQVKQNQFHDKFMTCGHLIKEAMNFPISLSHNELKSFFLLGFDDNLLQWNEEGKFA